MILNRGARRQCLSCVPDWCISSEEGADGVPNDRSLSMNYGKSGAPKPAKNAPRFDKHDASLSGKNATGGKASKAELLARMKAAAQTRKDS